MRDEELYVLNISINAPSKLDTICGEKPEHS